MLEQWMETGDSHPSPFPNPLTPPHPPIEKILIHKMNDKVIFYRQNYCFDLKGFQEEHYLTSSEKFFF